MAATPSRDEPLAQEERRGKTQEPVDCEGEARAGHGTYPRQLRLRRQLPAARRHDPAEAIEQIKDWVGYEPGDWHPRFGPPGKSFGGRR